MTVTEYEIEYNETRCQSAGCFGFPFKSPRHASAHVDFEFKKNKSGKHCEFEMKEAKRFERQQSNNHSAAENHYRLNLSYLAVLMGT